jgi:hypothetical protein
VRGEEWGSQREMSAEEVRQIGDQALRIVATKMYQMFGVEISPAGRKQDNCVHSRGLSVMSVRAVA